LWDQVLQLPADVVADGTVHTHTIPGPDGHPLLALERSVRDPEQPAAIWTLIVAADARDMQHATEAFSGTLAASLGVLWMLLALAGVAQVWIGLAPLRALQTEVSAVSRGLRPRLGSHFPAEVQPLANDLNAALDAQANNLAHARTQAGNLAHALKTPLAVLQQAADHALSTPAGPTGQALHALAQQVHDQVQTARRQVDWHLKRARAAAHAGSSTAACPLWPTLQSLVKVMGRVHAERHIRFELPDPPALPLNVEADEQDLQEMLGNLLDNACKWTHTHVAVRIEQGANTVTVGIQDDGPGIPAALQADMQARGARLDESAPGSGLGLAIVNELARLYGGQLQLSTGSTGGLHAALTLPKAQRSADASAS
jgi:signal transduction histidine kinase